VAETSEINVDVYTMFGSKLLEKKVNGQLRYEFSLTSQPPGVYILHVVTGKEVGTVKVIKQ
jgi:hypothetical protein